MTDILIPEVVRNGPLYRHKRKWMVGKKKGDRLTYVWKKRPYHHQVEAVKKLLSTGFGGALLMEPRTGKTKVAIDWLSILHAAGKANRVVVFTPVAGLGVWKDELEANCPFPYRLLIWDRKSRREGTRHSEELPRYGDDILDIVVMNYDALSTPGRVIPQRIQVCRICDHVELNHFVEGHEFLGGDIRTFTKHPVSGEIKRSRKRGGRFDIKKKLEAWQPQVIILDESHRIKAPTARKSTAIHALRNIPDYRLLMTGTVVTKKKRIFDVYSQWLFLNPQRFGSMTFSQFKSHFARFTHRNNYPQWLRNQNENELHRLIHLDAYSKTRDECFDLPRLTRQVIPVELEESAYLYDQMAEDMVARIHTGEITEASIQLVQGIRLRQITSGLARTTPTEEHPQGKLLVIGSEKLRVLQSRLEDLLDADEKVVIGALWKGDIARIQKLCAQLKVPTFTIKGGMKNEDREYARTQFPRVDGGAVFIGQPAAAGEAIDLSCASITIWYSLTPSWVNYKQFGDRTALSAKPTFHEHLLGRGTVDEILYETLLEDGNLGRKMITSPERLLRLRESGN